MKYNCHVAKSILFSFIRQEVETVSELARKPMQKLKTPNNRLHQGGVHTKALTCAHIFRFIRNEGQAE
jgi:hypothetical protein